MNDLSQMPALILILNIILLDDRFLGREKPSLILSLMLDVVKHKIELLRRLYGLDVYHVDSFLPFLFFVSDLEEEVVLFGLVGYEPKLQGIKPYFIVTKRSIGPFLVIF
jgi:hypothetical protein